jgi:hypothetical protein
MCYSAQLRAEYKKFLRLFGAVMSIKEFSKLYREREYDAKIKIPKSIDAEFLNPKNDEEREIKALIDAFNASQATKLEQELFKQRKRLVDAERSLQVKETKKATEDLRIATNKIAFAAFTDEPPPEIAAAGHDRCIIPIKPENVDTWLQPKRSNLAAQHAILDDRERPYYEHRLAA